MHVSAQVWLKEQNMQNVDVAVNISFSQIQDDRFVEIVKDIISRSGANAARIEFELTESTILKSPGSNQGAHGRTARTGYFLLTGRFRHRIFPAYPPH